MRRPIVIVLGGQLLALAVTGLYLTFSYQPTVAAAWNDIESLDRDVTVSLLAQTLHGWLALSTALTIVAAAASLAVGWFGLPRRLLQAGWLIAAGAVAVVTGYRLPWDQLALRRITAGTDISGFTSIFDDDVTFVLIDGTSVSTQSLQRDLIIHVLVGLALLAWTVWMIWLARRRVTLTSPSELDAADSLGPATPTKP